MFDSTNTGTPGQSPIPAILRSLQVLQALAKVFEIRVLGIPRGRAKAGNSAGWFSCPQAAFEVVQTYVMRKAAGIYVTLNPVNPALLARTNNKIVDFCPHATADKDIVKRVWLMVDFDPERPDGISSSQDEVAAAYVITTRCIDWLRDQFGWPDPLLAMSGNGFHLCYRIDLPNDEPSKVLIQHVLQGIAGEVREWQAGSAVQIKVDPVVFNAARIIKLWGTMARKGTDIPERPHRQSKLLNAPDVVAVVSVEQLESVAKLAPATKRQTAKLIPSSDTGTLASTPTGPQVLDRVRKYLAKLPPAVAGQEGHNATFRTACVLVKDFALSIDDALPIFREWSETCQPPWTDAELLHKLESAHSQPGPVGKLLQDDSPPRAKRRTASRQAVENINLNGIVAQDEAAEPKVKPPPPEFVPFPLDCLPEPVRTFVIETADSMNCDPSFVILPLISTTAATIGNACRIRLKNLWTEPCVFWTVVVGESGTMKSPALDAALAFLRKLQAKAFADHNLAMEQYKRDLNKYEADLANYKKPSSNRSSEPPEEPPMPVCKRFICEDTTVEALAAMLEQQPRGILMNRDELSGWLNSFDAYKSCKGSDVAHWLSMHRAGEMTVDRKSGKRITHIPRAAVSISGGIQPTTMATALAGRYRPNKDEPEAQVAESREHFDNGLAARLLLAMPPRKPKIWTDHDVSPEICDKLQSLFKNLVELEMSEDENGKPCPVDVQFTPEARKQWVQFYNEHALEQVQLNGDMAAAWSKLEGYAARFALLIHMIRYAGDDHTLKEADRVDEQSLAAAITISRWFGDETSRIYAEIGAGTEAPEQRERRLLLRIVKSHTEGMTARELMRYCRRYRNKIKAATAALQTLVEANLGFWRPRPTTGKGGRPTEEFVLFDQTNVIKPPPYSIRDANHDDEIEQNDDIDLEVSVPSPLGGESCVDVPSAGDSGLNTDGLDLS